MTRRALLALLLGAAVLGPGGQALAQASTDPAMSIIRSTMSPFCPGKTLDACPSSSATEWRADIRRWVAEGKSREEIHASLEARAPGFDLEGRPGRSWDWSIPVGSLLVASLGLAGATWSLRRRRDATTSPTNPAGAEARSRYDDAIALAY